MTVRPRERIKHQKLMAISLNNNKQRCQFFAPFFQRNLFECFPSLIASCLSYSFLLQNFRQSKTWLTAGVMQKKKKKRLCFHNTIMSFDVIPDCGRYVSEKIVTRSSLYDLNLIYNYTYIKKY